MEFFGVPGGLGGWSGVLGRPGGDLLSHALRRSTIGAEGFHGRVRDGIGCLTPRHSHQVVQAHQTLCASKAAIRPSDALREQSGERPSDALREQSGVPGLVDRGFSVELRVCPAALLLAKAAASLFRRFAFGKASVEAIADPRCGSAEFIAGRDGFVPRVPDGRARRIKPIERLVRLSFTHCCASTCLLSTWWSTTALKRDLVLRGVSRLDAFSGYPVRT